MNLREFISELIKSKVMAIPKQVRQRMINVMYIVLLALLALQIPKEVTEAFFKINNGIVTSSMALDEITAANREAIDFKGRNGNSTAADYAERSIKISEVSNEAFDYIDAIKIELTELIGVDEKTGKIKLPEEIPMTMDLLVHGDEDGQMDGLAYDLEERLIKAKNAMIDYLPKEKMDSLIEGSHNMLVQSLPLTALLTSTDQQDWVISNFDQLPAMGAIAVLSQMQSDLRYSENRIIEELRNQVDAGRLVFDNLSAKIIAPSSYILRGDRFKADMFLAASSSETGNISVIINGREYTPGRDGMVNYVADANTVGSKDISGLIRYKNPATGKTKDYPFDAFNYTVADPFANVTPTKMNVFYKGLQNPISVSAAGVLANDLRVSIDHGEISGSHGDYEVRVMALNDANVTVRDKDGVVHGVYPFRVKRTPDPVAEVAQMSGGVVKASVFQAQRALEAVLHDFVFNMEYHIVSYDMVYVPFDNTLQLSNSNEEAFSRDMKRQVNKARPRDRYDFENIRVRGEDEEVRRIPPITFKIN